MISSPGVQSPFIEASSISCIDAFAMYKTIPLNHGAVYNYTMIQLCQLETLHSTSPQSLLNQKLYRVHFDFFSVYDMRVAITAQFFVRLLPDDVMGFSFT